MPGCRTCTRKAKAKAWGMGFRMQWGWEEGEWGEVVEEVCLQNTNTTRYDAPLSPTCLSAFWRALMYHV